MDRFFKTVIFRNRSRFTLLLQNLSIRVDLQKVRNALKSSQNDGNNCRFAHKAVCSLKFVHSHLALFCFHFVNPSSANPAKWSITLRQFVGSLPTNCLSVFDHFVGLALKGLMAHFTSLFAPAAKLT